MCLSEHRVSLDRAAEELGGQKGRKEKGMERIVLCILSYKNITDTTSACIILCLFLPHSSLFCPFLPQSHMHPHYSLTEPH